MEWSTHALSGVVAGYLVTGGDWKGSLVGGVAGVIPDLDEPKSKFGRIFFPISIPLNKIFGHRTFTHSLLFAFLLSGVFCFYEKWVALSVFAGIIAHIFGDMLTGKVKLFYPSSLSVGIPIPQMFFALIDRMAKIALLVVLVYFVWSDFLSELKINQYFRETVDNIPFF